jgi:hypothetical protein
MAAAVVGSPQSMGLALSWWLRFVMTFRHDE